MLGGIGLISVPSSFSILYKLKRSSYVIKLIAKPRCPNLPDLPIRCKYVSEIEIRNNNKQSKPEFLGKSKLMTTLTA